MKSYVTIGAVLLLFAACTPQLGSPPGATSLANTKWRLVSMGQRGAETPVIEGTTITLEFTGERQAGGSGGCNSYSAQYERQDDRLSFGEITRTLMACEREGVDEQEQRFFDALATAGRFELAGDRLTLEYADGQSVLNWVTADGSPR
jgi:putative lipoprotein